MNEDDEKTIVLEMRIGALEAQLAALEAEKQAKREFETGAEGVEVRPLEGATGQAFAYGVEGTDCKFINCRFQFGRTVYSIADQTANADGTYYLVVPHANPSGASVVASNPGTDDDATSIPLITVQDGRITEDYRGMPVIPVYE